MSSLALLAEIRQSSERLPYEVLKLAEPLLNNNQLTSSTEDAWLVYEQVFLAALDEGQIDLAKSLLHILRTRFPASQRVKRLYGLVNEAAGHPDESQNLYAEITSADPTNVLALKRVIALLKAQGKLALAANELVAYLDTHGNDFEAWLELSHLYLAHHMYRQAAFCLEEVILQQPANHYFHLCYAEINYSMGQWDIALKEYLRVVELSTDNVRGFYGIKVTADRIIEMLASGARAGKSRREPQALSGLENVPQVPVLEKLSLLATERLVAAYSANNAAAAPAKALEDWLKQ
ncbi:tetratricopeptide repeat domain-containing protein [Coemansia interrupta]|uniref:ER membrane protein complex subunit 2 n=1 Tax=Coemansia interrupta TaxID=1126814 RepID=A0A9W8LF76_9FUNG|nr:tetratricopeptide repeat domain-containing protein [Coemansia interrupta]